MKYLVTSVEQVPLLDPFSSNHVHAVRPSVVYKTPFMDALIGESRVLKLEELEDEASDLDFESAHHKDPEAAVLALPVIAKPEPKAALKADPMKKPVADEKK